MAVKGMNEGVEELELDFNIYNSEDGQPNLLVRVNGEEYIFIALDEVNLDMDRSNMIQSEADAQLLENIEAQLTTAIVEAETQP